MPNIQELKRQALTLVGNAMQMPKLSENLDECIKDAEAGWDNYPLSGQHHLEPWLDHCREN